MESVMYLPMESRMVSANDLACHSEPYQLTHSPTSAWQEYHLQYTNLQQIKNTQLEEQKQNLTLIFILHHILKIAII